MDNNGKNNTSSIRFEIRPITAKLCRNLMIFTREYNNVLLQGKKNKIEIFKAVIIN